MSLEDTLSNHFVQLCDKFTAHVFSQELLRDERLRLKRFES